MYENVTQADRKRIEKMIRTKRLSVGVVGWLFQCGILMPYIMLCVFVYYFFTPHGSDHINWWVIIFSAFGGIGILDWKISQLYFDTVKSTLTEKQLFALLEKLAQENDWTIVCTCGPMVEIEDRYRYGLTVQTTKIIAIYTPQEVLVNCIIDPYNNGVDKAAVSSSGQTTYNKELVINRINEHNNHLIK